MIAIALCDLYKLAYSLAISSINVVRDSSFINDVVRLLIWLVDL